MASRLVITTRLLANRLQRPDPVYRFFDRIFHGRALVAALTSAIIYVGIWFIVSQAIRSTHPPIQVVYYNNIDELTFGLFLWGFFVPALWWYYISVPYQWQKMTQSLLEKRVVNDEVDTILQPTTYPLFTAIIAVGIGILYYFGGMPAEIETGRVSFWFAMPWSQILIVLIVAFNGYLFVTFVLSTLIYSFRLGVFFLIRGVLRLHFFDVDECGELGAVGSLAMRISSLAVLVGIWAIWFTYLPFLGGGTANYSFMVILLYFAYVILAVLLLFLLSYPVHLAMLNYKLDYKNKVACKLDGLMALYAGRELEHECDGPAEGTHSEDYQRLLLVYERVDALPVWPFSMRSLRRFTGIVSIPGIIGTISFVVDIMNIFTSAAR